jgi:phosphoglycerate dehydrogenase-like enzyme
MKIFLETKYVKKEDYQPLIDAYPQYLMTFKEEKDCEILIGMFDKKPKTYFDQFVHLKWIILISSGYNHLDFNYLTQRGIRVTNAKGVYDIQIAEDVIAKMLYFNKNMHVYDNYRKKHMWKHQGPHYELYQQEALILGAGSIGQDIAKRLKAFDMKIIGYKRTHKSLPYFDKVITDLKTLSKYYKTCDYLIIALPLNEYTESMVDASVLNQLKPSTLIINIGRGEIIDQDALIKALNLERIRGAALDVTTPEPLPKDHKLWDAKHIYISPHNASASPKVQERRINMVIELLKRDLNHQDIFNVVLKGSEDIEKENH